MKLSSTTMRNFGALHTWVGLVAGFALFVAFYAGAITVFQHDVARWANSATATPVGTMDQSQQLLDEVLARHSAARAHVGMVFPGDDYAQPVAYWQNAKGVWQYATSENLVGSPRRPFEPLSELLNTLHYSLGIPDVGIWLMGLVSLLYGVAILSGVIIHLPRLTKDLFALRPGRNLKRFWQDAHNVIGVLSLPFHVVFALTGTLLCLSFVLMMALGPLAFRGQLTGAASAAMATAPVVEAAGIGQPMTPLALWYSRSKEAALAQGVTEFEPEYLKLANAGDAHAVVEIGGHASGGLGSGAAIALDATTGAVLASDVPGHRDANHATLSAAYSLHYGDYGHAPVQWLYFLLGLGGAFLFYSGNLLWIESRRRRRQVSQGRAQIGMAKATVGVCIGLCVAVSASFVAAQVLPALRTGGDLAWGEAWACYGTWALCALWAALRHPARAAFELLWLAAIVTALIPVAHGVASGSWLWQNAVRGDWNLALIDLVAVAMAAAFVAAARATRRRALHGNPYSVWSAGAAQ